MTLNADREKFGKSAFNSAGSVPQAYHAWLAPLAGWLFAIFAAVWLIPKIAADEGSRAILIISGLIPLLGMLACVGFGFFKSFQCVKERRSLGHGSAGLLVNIGTVALLGFTVYTTFTTARLLATPQGHVELAVRELNKELPTLIDANTTATRAYASPETTLNIEHLVHGMPAYQINATLLEELEDLTTRRVKKDSSPFKPLLDSGANIHYIYMDENDKVLREFTVSRKE